jgi:hypothetical protein
MDAGTFTFKGTSPGIMVIRVVPQQGEMGGI